jgi:hypothetical protein
MDVPVAWPYDSPRHYLVGSTASPIRALIMALEIIATLLTGYHFKHMLNLNYLSKINLDPKQCNVHTIYIYAMDFDLVNLWHNVSVFSLKDWSISQLNQKSEPMERE